MPAGPMTAKGRLVAKGTPGMTVTMKVRRPVPQGTPVYRTVQAAQLAEAQALMSQPYRRKIPVQAVFKAQIGALPELTLTDPQGVIAKVCGEASAQQATASGWTQADLARQLSKLGDTPFVFETCRIEAESGFFLPVSALNALRRAAAEALMQARIRRFEDRGERPCRTARKHAALLPESPLADQPSLAGYVEDLNLPLEVFAGLDIVAYDPRRWPIDGDAVLPWVKALKQKGYSVRLVLPRITRSADMELLRRTPENLWNCFDEVMAGNLGQMKLMKDLGVIGILTDFSFNITNSRALAHLKDLGAAGAVLSTELTTTEIRDIIRRRCLPCEILVFGRMPLLISEACLKDRRDGCGECAEGGTELIDRMGYRFPVLTRIAARCYTEIYNSVWTFTAEDCAALLAAGADGWGLRLSGLTTRQIPDIIALYRHGRSHPNTPLPKPLQQASEAVKAMGFTRGRFFRRIE
jgi:putative protease